jgi:hypothetical protein
MTELRALFLGLRNLASLWITLAENSIKGQVSKTDVAFSAFYICKETCRPFRYIGSGHLLKEDLNAIINDILEER